MTTDDYLKAALIVSKCRNERLPYVLDLLEQGGFKIPKLHGSAEKIPVIAVSEAINDALDKHGFTLSQLCNLTGLDKTQLSRYRSCSVNPRKERALYLIKIINDAVSAVEK